MSTVIGLTRQQAREQADHDKAAERASEAACRLDFRVYGDGQAAHVLGHAVQPITHAERCVCSPKCSFTYDPTPYDEAEPVDLRLYEGTSIAALYQAPDSDTVTAALGGWTLTPRSDRYE